MPKKQLHRTKIDLKRHDLLQLEVKLGYPVGKTSSSQHSVDIWFHLPPAIGIGAGNYENSDFYRDVRTYTRMTIPVLSIGDLVNNGEGSPLTSLTMIAGLIGPNGPTKKQQSRIRQEVRLLACIYTRQLDRRLQYFASQGVVLHETEKLLQDMQNLIQQWRQLQQRFRQHKLKKKTLRAFAFADESMSIFTEYSCSKILHLLQEKGMNATDDIIAFALREREYRQTMGFDSILDSESNGTSFLIRYGNLRKYTNSVLFLNAVEDKISKWFRHAALGFAAALAMAWAVLAQIFVFFQLGIELNQNMSFSILSLFFVLAIFSYVLKDRIKATTGGYFSKVIAKWFHDRKKLHYLGDSDVLITQISERMNFVYAERAPKKFRKLWNVMEKSNLSIMVGGEILWYQRKVILHNRQAQTSFPRFSGVSDILRIQLWRWVQTLDDIDKSLIWLDQKKAKPYHIK